MRKTINNKSYDTNAATPVGSWENIGLAPDSEAVRETLYRKRTGEYFLLGEGGEDTPYAARLYGTVGPGKKILPLTYDEARDWGRRRLDSETYEGEFTASGGYQSVPMAHLNVIIPEAAKNAIGLYAVQEGKSLSWAVGELARTLPTYVDK